MCKPNKHNKMFSRKNTHKKRTIWFSDQSRFQSYQKFDEQTQRRLQRSAAEIALYILYKHILPKSQSRWVFFHAIADRRGHGQ